MGVMDSNNGEQGTSVVEFALVLPLLLILLFGVIEFGFILYNQAMITNACREGARFGIMMKSPRRTEEEIRTIVVTYCVDALIHFGGSPDPIVDAPPPVSPVFGDDLTVTVTYPYTFLFVPNFMPLIPQTLDLRARVIMKYE